MLKSISCLSKSKNSQGFTLIEILVVLFLASLIFAAVLPTASNLLLQEQVRGTARKISLFAKTARTQALTEQQPYHIIFAKNTFTISPLTPPKKGDPHQGITESYQLSKEILCQIRSWEEVKWSKTEKFEWIFQPTGLCEPIRIRFSKDNAWYEMEFNPLTANTQNESYYFP
ncbi:MAG: prepilin-type N-terminal cleavage/methylation domain-containing protein [Verrucomicrobiae bacterium]|nr:prepilin-type N-terminal cleavage/methylation domain-containing protein [Verrucomicrobiae bacterium]